MLKKLLGTSSNFKHSTYLLKHQDSQKQQQQKQQNHQFQAENDLFQIQTILKMEKQTLY